MLWVLIIVVFVVLILFVLYFSPVVFKVDFSRLHGDDEGELHIHYLFGLIHIKKSLTKIQAQMTSSGPQVHIEHSGVKQVDNQIHRMISVDDVWQVLRNIREWLSLFHQILPIMRKLLSRMHIVDLNLDIKIGVGDVIGTGMAVGTLWALLESILGISSRTMIYDTLPDLNIQPDFQKPIFNLELHSIMQVRAGYAIRAAFRLLRAWKRRTLNGSSNSRTHADGHGEHSGDGGRQHHHRRSS